MSEKFIIIRQELVKNAVAAIAALYTEQLADIQSVQDGDGKKLNQIYWGAMTPRFEPKTTGYLPQWTHQEIELELRASVDYADRALDARYNLLLQVFEDFCARPDLADRLSSEDVIVQSPPTFEAGAESIENGRYVTSYSLRCKARGRVTGE
jgi:hypothetical protein